MYSWGWGRDVRAMSSATLVPGLAEAPRAAAGHTAFLFVSVDFAVQAVHVLGQGHRNIWRKVRPASESLLSCEPRPEMYVKCDLYVRQLAP